MADTDANASMIAYRAQCAMCKRWIFALTNLVTGIITCIFISHAFAHYKVISANPTTLKNPYGNFDLANEKMSYAFAVGKAIFAFSTMIFSIWLPEHMIFNCAILNLIFEIPMAAVAQSNFGAQVTFANLGLTNVVIGCYASFRTTQQWSFYSAYANVTGSTPRAVCLDFVQEGSLLRGGLMFGWFAMWIPVFLVSLLYAAYKDEKRWSDLLMFMTGYDFDCTWAHVRKCFSVKISRPTISVPRLRRRKSVAVSNVSTLADEAVDIKVDQKV